jgi:hypothetical protein
MPFKRARLQRAHQGPFKGRSRAFQGPFKGLFKRARLQRLIKGLSRAFQGSYKGPFNGLLQAKAEYLDLAAAFEQEADPKILAQGKHACDISAMTETTVMAVLAFKKEKDKGKLRTMMQQVIKHLKEVQATYVAPHDNMGQPTAILHEALKKRIAAALRLR